MTKEIEKRIEKSRELHPRLKDIRDLDERAAWRCGYDDGYKAGMTDPEANADIIAERESLIQIHLNTIKKFEKEKTKAEAAVEFVESLAKDTTKFWNVATLEEAKRIAEMKDEV